MVSCGKITVASATPTIKNCPFVIVEARKNRHIFFYILCAQMRKLYTMHAGNEIFRKLLE
jgi:hypothetical protein